MEQKWLQLLWNRLLVFSCSSPPDVKTSSASIIRAKKSKATVHNELHCSTIEVLPEPDTGTKALTAIQGFSSPSNFMSLSIRLTSVIYSVTKERTCTYTNTMGSSMDNITSSAGKAFLFRTFQRRIDVTQTTCDLLNDGNIQWKFHSPTRWKEKKPFRGYDRV